MVFLPGKKDLRIEIWNYEFYTNNTELMFRRAALFPCCATGMSVGLYRPPCQRDPSLPGAPLVPGVPRCTPSQRCRCPNVQGCPRYTRLIRTGLLLPVMAKSTTAATVQHKVNECNLTAVNYRCFYRQSCSDTLPCFLP